MRRELAKQLKDAGFPQRYHYDEQGRRSDFRDTEVCANPTLWELIEECGDDFRELHRTLNSEWFARGDQFKAEYASTTEDAVAKLWSAIH
jgi:hypothetical protein